MSSEKSIREANVAKNQVIMNHLLKVYKDLMIEVEAKERLIEEAKGASSSSSTSLLSKVILVEDKDVDLKALRGILDVVTLLDSSIKTEKEIIDRLG